MSKRLTLPLNRFVPCSLLAFFAAVLLTPAIANATPVNYEFTVTATSGSLNGTVSHGTFSYDNSSITPGMSNYAVNLLTALDFTWNGTTYNAATANTGWLTFGAAGQLDGFAFGNNCKSAQCTVDEGTEEWYVAPDTFVYSVLGDDDYGLFGNITYSLATTSVPEPAALGMFGFGVLLIGGFVTLRRRTA